jgi:CO dehydrogenase maturation factor
MMPNEPFFQNIRTARNRKGLTQAELATRIGVSQGTISFWESGTESPKVEHLIALALELPELIESFQGRERELLQRILRLERELFDGRCACKGCKCSAKTAQPAIKRSRSHNQEETMKIAISGKGGVGKTTIAGTLARILARRQHTVLALDVDSNPNLGLSLGISSAQMEQLPAVPHGLTEWRQDAQGHAYVHLRCSIPEFIANYGVPTSDGVQLLMTGEVAEASAGCRCEAHAVARGITGQLMGEAGVVVLDMEAGLEHLGRGTTEHVDILLIVVEPYYRALMTATHIRDLAAQLELPRIAVIANQVRSEQDLQAIEQFCRNHNLELLGIVPYDEAILEAERMGKAPLDHAPGSPAMRAIDELATTLEQ